MEILSTIALSIVTLLACQSNGVMAMLSSPHTFQETQPNGQVIDLKINGDPFDSWISDLDGHTVLKDAQTGYFVYAQEDGNGGLEASHELVENPQEPSMSGEPPRELSNNHYANPSKKQKHLRPSKRDCTNMICDEKYHPYFQSNDQVRRLDNYRSRNHRHLRGQTEDQSNYKPENSSWSIVQHFREDTLLAFNETHPYDNEDKEKNDENNSDHSNRRTLFRTTGRLRNLVVLLQWGDHVNRNLPSPHDIDILMNHDGPHALCPTGSVRDVFLQNSYGALQLESTVTDWIVMNNTEAYYSNGTSGKSTRIWEAIGSALEYIDTNSLINFGDFDEDQDGRIDSITFLHSGYGAEFGGTDEYGQFYLDRIWSHKWGLYEEPFLSKDGVRVLEYHISPSLWGWSGSGIGRIGVIAHETGHFLGIPDLYDVDGGGVGVGFFDFMANGWGYDWSQYYPPPMSPWTKLVLGWAMAYFPSLGINEVQAAETQDPSLPQIYVITEGFPDGEFLLIENRQRKGYSQIMPQSGILIWHIDHGASINDFFESLKREGHPWQENWPQNGNHYGVALVQSDGQYHLERSLNAGDSGDFFHANGVNQLLPCQDPAACQFPNTDSYKGGIVTRTNVSITDISVSGEIMKFNYNAGSINQIEATSAPTVAPSPAVPSDKETCLASGQRCHAFSRCCSGECGESPRARLFLGRCV